MNKKEILNRIICTLLGAVIGVTATVGIWYYKEMYQYKIGIVNKADISEFQELQYWDKVCYYYENELQIFFDSYESIYSTYSIYSYIDESIKQYFEQYGIDAVLCSGLKSGNKLGQIYCIEKLCGIIGNEKLNKKQLLKALDDSIIDEQLYTDLETEKQYIDFAKERKELAISLFNNSTECNKILSNNKSRYAWISNAFSGNKQIRLYDNGFYYTLEDKFLIEDLKESEFISENCLKIKAYHEVSRIIIFDKNIISLDLCDEIKKHMISGKIIEEYMDYIMWIREIEFQDGKIVGNINVEEYSGGPEPEKCTYKFTYDTKGMQVSDIYELYFEVE